MASLQSTKVRCQGVRGAITVEENTATAIERATQQLVSELLERNAIDSADIASMLFSLTPDLDAAFPAAAARELGLGGVALFCMQEIAVPGALARCLRVLIHWNTERSQEEIEHVYLGAAAALRPERSSSRSPS